MKHRLVSVSISCALEKVGYLETDLLASQRGGDPLPHHVFFVFAANTAEHTAAASGGIRAGIASPVSGRGDGLQAIRLGVILLYVRHEGYHGIALDRAVTEYHHIFDLRDAVAEHISSDDLKSHRITASYHTDPQKTKIQGDRDNTVSLS